MSQSVLFFLRPWPRDFASTPSLAGAPSALVQAALAMKIPEDSFADARKTVPCPSAGGSALLRRAEAFAAVPPRAAEAPTAAKEIPAPRIENDLRAKIASLGLRDGGRKLWLRRNAPHWPKLGESLRTLDSFVRHFEAVRGNYPDVGEGLLETAVGGLKGFQDEIETLVAAARAEYGSAATPAERSRAISRINQIWDFLTYLEGLKLSGFNKSLLDDGKNDLRTLREEFREFRRASGAAKAGNKRGTKTDLYRFLGIDPGAMAEEGDLAPGWRGLLGEVRDLSRRFAELAPFDSYEAGAFLAKFAGQAYADAELAAKARALYDLIPDDRFKVKFLRMVLYCPDPAELRFIVEKLSLYHDKYADFGDFISSLYGDFRSEFLTGHKLRGFYFELRVLDILSSKGYRIEVVRAGSDEAMGRGGTQEIDLTVKARGPDGREITFYLELYSGSGDPGGGKKDQLDRYISAALARQIGVAIVTLADGGDGFRTSAGKVVPRLALSALLMMGDAQLSDLLFAEYAQYLAQFGRRD